MNWVMYLKFGAVWLLVVALVWAVPEALHQRKEADRYSALYAKAAKEVEDQKALTERIQKAVQQADKDAARARLKLKEALDAVPTWRDGSVPAPVVDSLCGTLRCIKPGGVSAPTG